MPRPIYSAQLFCAGALTGNHPVTVPAGQVYVLRDMDAWAETSHNGDELLVRGTNGNIIWAVLCDGTFAGSLKSWRGRQVIPQGTTFSVNAASGSWDIAISGYILTA